MLCSIVSNPGFAIFSAKKNSCLLQDGRALAQRLLEAHEKWCTRWTRTLRWIKPEVICSHCKQPHRQKLHSSIQGCKLSCWCPGSSFCTQQQKEIKAQTHGCCSRICTLRGSGKVMLRSCCELQMLSKDRHRGRHYSQIQRKEIF